MESKKVILGEREKEILKLLGAGALIVTSLAIPNLPLALKPFLSSKQNKFRYKKIIKRLEEKNIIYLSGDKVKLSKKGLHILKMIESEEITITKTAWDGIWRIIAYDIPDENKKARDYFRKKLIGLDFKQIQESMLAIPYDCQEEIAIFAQQLGISPYVIYLTTPKLPKQKELIAYYNL